MRHVTFLWAILASLTLISGCMRAAAQVQRGINPFVAGNVVFEGGVSLNVLEPKKPGPVFFQDKKFSDSVALWSTSDFKLRFIAEDGHYIDCPVLEGRFNCVLPQNRYKYFLLQGLNLAGFSGNFTSGVKLKEFLQWFRIPEQANGPNVANHLGTIVIEHYPEFELTGMGLPVPNATASIVTARPDVILVATTYVDSRTKATVDDTQLLKFREAGTLTRIEAASEAQRQEILAKYPPGTNLQHVELQPHSRACFFLSMLKSTKPHCGYGFMNDDFAEKPVADRFD